MITRQTDRETQLARELAACREAYGRLKGAIEAEIPALEYAAAFILDKSLGAAAAEVVVSVKNLCFALERAERVRQGEKT